MIINIQKYKMRFKTSIFHQRIIRSIQLGMKWMLQLKVSFSVSSHILLTWVFFSADLVKYEMKAKKMSEMVGLHLKGNPRYILFGWSYPWNTNKSGCKFFLRKFKNVAFTSKRMNLSQIHQKYDRWTTVKFFAQKNKGVLFLLGKNAFAGQKAGDNKKAKDDTPME